MGKDFLKDEHDAFGHMLWARYRGENVFEIIERDDGYVDATDPSKYFSDYEDWTPIQKQAYCIIILQSNMMNFNMAFRIDF